MTYGPEITRIDGKPGQITHRRGDLFRIDAFLKDPLQVEGSPSFTLGFSGEGLPKFEELIRIGKTQRWTAEDLTAISGNLPFLPSTIVPGLLIEVSSQPSEVKIVRLEIGLSEPVIFQMMRLQILRAGTDETEMILFQEKVPLRINFTVKLDGTTQVDARASWMFKGYDFSACHKTLRAVDAFSNAAPIRIIDLASEQLIFETQSPPGYTDAFSPEPRRIISLIAQIEKLFWVSIPFRDKLSANDREILVILDCLLNSRPYGSDLEAIVQINKMAGKPSAQLEQALSGKVIAVIQAATNSKDYFELLGVRFPARRWGMWSETCHLIDGPKLKSRYLSAPVGTVIKANLVAPGPTFLRWMDEFPLSN